MMGIGEQIDSAEPLDPLSNPEAELRLLSDLIADNRLIDPAADLLRPVDFSVPLHGQVFSLLLEHTTAGKSIDAVTLAPFLKNEDGWPRLYSKLAAAHLNASPKAQTKAYLEQVTALSGRRRLVIGLQDVIMAARSLELSKDELVVRADEAVAEIADGAVEVEQAPVGDYAQLVIDSFGKPIVGVRCGMIGSLDDILGVLRAPDFIVVGARPGMGKTSTVTSYAIGAAARGHATLLFSLEMSADQLTRRILADICYSTRGGVLADKITQGTVTGDDYDRVIAAKQRLDQLPLEINDRGGLTLALLKRRVRRHKRRLAAQGKKLELVIVDYLQLMAPSNPKMSLYESATEISKGLKTLAKEEKLVVMAVAQLSRDVEKRVDKRPIPSDLRDSGQIEQDADVILFLYREEEYLKRTKPADELNSDYDKWRTDMDVVRGKIEFLVPKRRSGPTGAAMGWFFGEYSAVRGAEFYRVDGGQHG